MKITTYIAFILLGLALSISGTAQTKTAAAQPTAQEMAQESQAKAREKAQKSQKKAQKKCHEQHPTAH